MESAIILAIPEAEPLVGALRAEGDVSAGQGVPAHITLLYPFADDPDEGIVEELRFFFAAVDGFALDFVAVGEFPEVVYLAPHQARVVEDLIGALERRWPRYPPYGGVFDVVVPHLTVVDTPDPALRGRWRRPCGCTLRTVGPAGRPSRWRRQNPPDKPPATGHPWQMHSLVVGFGLGFLVALQLGPMSLFLVRSTLRGGVLTGLGVGAGIALIDALYAAAGAAGAAPLLLIDPVRFALGLVGAAVIMWLGIKTLRAAMHVRAGLDGDAADTPGRAFRTSLGATASNPATIVSWAAIFAAVSATSETSAVPLVVGVGVGSLTWVALLAVVTAAVRKAVGVRAIQIADGVAGLGLLGFGGVLGWQTLHDS
jgi:putative LysE/RhtB family amino acid efflux pump